MLFKGTERSVRLTLEVGVTEKISRRVATGALDLAVCSAPAANLGLTFEPLFQDPISLLLPASNALSTAKEIVVADLAEERLILTEEHCPYRDVLEKALLSEGINPYSGIESMEFGSAQADGSLRLGYRRSARSYAHTTSA